MYLADLKSLHGLSLCPIANLRLSNLLTPPSRPRSFGSKPPLPHPPPNLFCCDPNTLWLASNVVMELGPRLVLGGLIFVQCGYPSIPCPALDAFPFLHAKSHIPMCHVTPS